MPMRLLGNACNISPLSNSGITDSWLLTRLAIRLGVPGMASKRPSLKKLSPTAGTELKRLMTLCRRLRLSVSKLHKVKRIVRILYDPVE